MNTHDLALFVRIADSGSITNAAQQLDITSAAASAALKRLEKELAVQLFIRSTRQLRMTAEGERFLLHCRQALDALEEGKASMNALHGKVSGELRISAPSDISRNVLNDCMDEIMELHPNLSIHLNVSDSMADFYLDRVDLALRFGQPEDSSLIAFKVAAFDRILCASPSYLNSFGMPSHPNDLKQHNCLIYQLNNRLFDLWSFSCNLGGRQESVKVKVNGDRSSNDGDVVRRWVVKGKGIAYKSRLDMAEDLHAGRVVRLLPSFSSAPVELNLICPTRKQVTPAALLLRDTLRKKFSKLLNN